MNRSFALKSYFRYLRKARHREGFGIHSPFVFRLLNAVFYEKMIYYCYGPIEDLRGQLEQVDERVKLTDYGTGGYPVRSVADIAKRSVKRSKYAQLLFRLANFNCSQNILELGTCLGLTTLYLSAVNSQAKLVTIEGDEALCRLASGNFKRMRASNIDLRCGAIDDILPAVLTDFNRLDFVFFDANHTLKATLLYFEACLPKVHKDTIFVFDDIYRSQEMEQAWKTIRNHPKICLSIDIFEMGIVFFNTDLIKQSYIVAF
jgi:predicted O-methyltransferase YrrM